MAIGATAVWEVRTTGNDANGGFYTSGGTDYSQQDAAQLSVADGATNGTTTVTSATGGFTAAMIGNGINIAGTIRQITARADTNTITVDATVAAAGGQAMRVGGALASPGKAAGAAVGGNSVWVKYGVYTIGGGTANTSGNRVDTSVSSVTVRFQGYDLARGDRTGNRPILRATAGTMTLILTGASAHYSYIGNFRAEGNGQTAIVGFSNGSGRSVGEDCESYDCATGFNSYFPKSYAQNCTTGFVSGGAACVAKGCATGFSIGGYVLCIAFNGGVGFTANPGGAWQAINCVAYGNTSHGFNENQNGVSVLNCISVSNGGKGYSLNQLAIPVIQSLFTYNNTGGTSFGTPLSGDPFTNAAGGDFSLNNVAGAGALVRAAGFPGAFPGLPTTVGYIDAGAAQHADAGGGGKPRIMSASLIRGVVTR